MLHTIEKPKIALSQFLSILSGNARFSVVFLFAFHMINNSPFANKLFYLFYTCARRLQAAWCCYTFFRKKMATAQILLKSRRYLVSFYKKLDCTKSYKNLYRCSIHGEAVIIFLELSYDFWRNISASQNLL